MPKKQKSASKSSPTLGVQGSRDGLTHALEPVATALAEELAALLAAVLDGRKKRTLDRLSLALGQAVPELLRQVFEQEILARGAVATERRTALVATLRAEETPPYPPFTGATSALGTDDNSDWMSSEAVERLLDVSPANVKKLAEDGALGAVDANGSGLHRHERAAVLAYYNETTRRKRK